MALSIHSGAPAWAELATVPPETALQAARPLPQQPIDKGRIWFVLIVGASALFGATVLLENRAAWFPAIAKANQAMKSAATASSRNGEVRALRGSEETVADAADR
ncbi:hypothetical protein APUTEX25_005558 [Auxenochlorella protothecoides]|uniref:Uncharacterized protein n=1 Tax=Auxenochlorella protothecoides TaxID=3075 RepID=A0A3M7KZQ0_AUXPR|nr:hypothetical protein APUTEX25_005558 [Auxenochlorella protothecoides]|eukprot:RMZ55280.1 hypothetical protein APUTEX25_005558 [Auxenochlorella protothecoides]